MCADSCVLKDGRFELGLLIALDVGVFVAPDIRVLDPSGREASLWFLLVYVRGTEVPNDIRAVVALGTSRVRHYEHHRLLLYHH